MEQYTEANNAGRTGRKGRSRSVGTAEVMKYVIAVLILGYEYSSDASISVEEVLLIEAKNEAQTAEIREAVERRIEQRRNDFDGYAPEQVQLLENAQVLVRGRFVFMAVSPDAEQYRTAFVKSL